MIYGQTNEWYTCINMFMSKNLWMLYRKSTDFEVLLLHNVMLSFHLNLWSIIIPRNLVVVTQLTKQVNHYIDVSEPQEEDNTGYNFIDLYISKFYDEEPLLDLTEKKLWFIIYVQCKCYYGQHRGLAQVVGLPDASGKTTLLTKVLLHLLMYWVPFLYVFFNIFLCFKLLLFWLTIHNQCHLAELTYIIIK